MSEIPSNRNKIIAKNTTFLYIRMFVMIGITFYTSRLVLEALGVDDFGIYNVVGGIVVLFSFLNTAMTNASQRYISYALGTEDQNNIRKIFCTSVNCHLVVSLFLLVVAESIGLWIVTHILKIPDESYSAALVVYQCCVCISIVSIVQVPYSASIISYENMIFYSYISIIEATLKLGVVFIILHSDRNRLIEYALLNLIVSVAIIVIYITYVHIKFTNCRYSFIWDKSLFKSMMSFSGWSMVSGGSVIISQQGGNILLNYFFGVAVNAAYGLSSQVSSAINSFVTNFQIAFKPQIVKLYASNQIEEETKLINRSSKYSFYLLLLVFIPFVINGEKVLSMWLKQVPEYTLSFCIWIMVYLLIDAVQAPIWIAIYATGKIKKYTIGSSIFTLMNIPIAYIFLFEGFDPIIVLVIRAVLNLIFSVYRMITIKKLIGYEVKPYILMFVRHSIPCMIIALSLSYLLKLLFTDTIIGFLIVTLGSILIVLSSIFIIGLNRAERNFIKNIITNKFRIKS